MKRTRRRQARCQHQDSIEQSIEPQGAAVDPRTQELVTLASSVQQIAVRNQYGKLADPYTQSYHLVRNYMFSGQGEGVTKKKDLSKKKYSKGLRKLERKHF